MFKVFLLLVALLSCSSCINIPIGESKKTMSKHVSFRSPGSGFQMTNSFNADQSWIHKKSGSIISYKSECPSSLTDMQSYLNNIASQFPNRSTNFDESFKYNNRKAHRLDFTGEVEGVTSKFDLVAFKKYGCLFLVSHSGVTHKVEQTTQAFGKFLNDFVVKK